MSWQDFQNAVDAELKESCNPKACCAISYLVHAVLDDKGLDPQFMVVEHKRPNGKKLTKDDFKPANDVGNYDACGCWHAHLVVVCRGQLIDFQPHPLIMASCPQDSEIVECTAPLLVYRLYCGNVTFRDSNEFKEKPGFATVPKLKAMAERLKTKLKDWTPIF